MHKPSHSNVYLKSIYSRTHKGIVAHGADVDASNVELLRGMPSVFLCIDASAGKKFIVEKLEEFGIVFIDTSMGLYAKDERLGGILRVTTSEPENQGVARARMSFAESNGPNEYDKNIQVADLNALNAILAVIRWKKLRGFYLKHERFSTYRSAATCCSTKTSMNKVERLSAEFVDFIPTTLTPGVLHVSRKYRTASHLCCCGCGSKVVTPLKPRGWVISSERELVTLDPSIGSWNLPCQSHYFIRGGRIVWAPRWSRKEIEEARHRDRADREAHFDPRPRRQSPGRAFIEWLWKTFGSR